MAAPFNWHWTQWIMEWCRPCPRRPPPPVAPPLHVKTISLVLRTKVPPRATHPPPPATAHPLSVLVSAITRPIGFSLSTPVSFVLCISFLPWPRLRDRLPASSLTVLGELSLAPIFRLRLERYLDDSSDETRFPLLEEDLGFRGEALVMRFVTGESWFIWNETTCSCEGESAGSFRDEVAKRMVFASLSHDWTSSFVER